MSRSTAPFVVLHVCMGNICRSPMAERLLAHAVRDRLGDRAEEFVLSESAGTGGWHAGEAMNPPAAKELRRRGALDTGFRARKVLGSHIDTADLILTATAEQLDYIAGLRADAMDRAFVLGQFGRLAEDVDVEALPPAGDDPDSVHARGVALVHAMNAVRSGAEPEPGDDLDDPWGHDEAFFIRTGDQIAAAVDALVEALLPKGGR